MIKCFRRHAAPDEVGRALQMYGAAVVEGYVAREVVERIRSEIEPHMPDAFVGRDPFAGFKTRRLGGLVVRSPTFAHLLIDPMMMGVCDRILLPHCSLYQLSYTQAIEINPGEPAQMLHEDDAIYNMPRPHPELEVLFALAVTDFTEENGATRMVLGSHRWAQDRVPQPEETVPVAMSAGSVMFFLGSTWHGGGSNKSAHPRLGMFAKYCLGHLRQEENQFLIAPLHIARDLDPKLRGLIGYKVCLPFLGGVLDSEIMKIFVDA